MDPNAAIVTPSQPAEHAPFVREQGKWEKVKDFLKSVKYIGGGIFVVLLIGGVAGSVFLSQQRQDIQQHASANYLPPDGFGVYDNCAVWASWCFTNLDTFAQGGFKLVLNYGAFNGSTTLKNLTDYATKAQQNNMKIIWSLKDMWTDKFTTMATYPELARESNCSSKFCLAAWIVNRVKGFPATWGYYIADEPTSSQYATVANLSNLIHTADPNHPRIIVKDDVLFNGVSSNITALGQFAPAAEVLGEDWYPVAYRQNIANTGTIANEIQYIAGTVNHKQSTIVLEVNAGNSSDGVHATAYPSETQMEEMLTLALQHSQPRMVLWYWYPGTSTTQWNNVVTAIKTVTGLSPTASLPPVTAPPTDTVSTDTSANPSPTAAPSVCTGGRSGGGSDTYDDANGPFVNCVKVTSCTTTTCSATVTWQENTRSKADEYKMVLYPPRPGKSGTYELLTFKNTFSASLTGLKKDTKYTMKISAWPNGVFRQGYGTPYYYFYAVMSAFPTSTGSTTSSGSTSGGSDSTAAGDSGSTSPSPSDGSIPADAGSPADTSGDSSGDTSSGSSLTGDINADGVVSIVDYNILMSCYNKSLVGICKNADLNNDQAVDGIDYNILLRAMIGQ